MIGGVTHVTSPIWGRHLHVNRPIIDDSTRQDNIFYLESYTSWWINVFQIIHSIYLAIARFLRGNSGSFFEVCSHKFG